MRNAEQWIEDLGMIPLPEEGGWFKEIYRSDEFIPKDSLPERFPSKRTYSSSIIYLLKSTEFSAFHRIKQEEIWHFYEGSSLTVHIIKQNREYEQVKLGRNLDRGESFQIVIRRGDFFAANVNDENTFSLVGCTVAPGFEFEDFEAPKRSALLELYPEHKDVIMKLTY
ncbi:MAG: cupin domain-containing protein [Pseudomonadota bacterium]